MISRETTHASLNSNIADANGALLKSCESTIRVSTYYWHEAVWSFVLLLSISSAFVDRWVELLKISCVYLNSMTIEALFSPILVLTLHVVLMAMVQCHKLRKSLHQTFIKAFMKATGWSLET